MGARKAAAVGCALAALAGLAACASSAGAGRVLRAHTAGLMGVTRLRLVSGAWLSNAVIDYYLPANGQELATGDRYLAKMNAALNDEAYNCMETFKGIANDVMYARNIELYLNPPEGSPLLKGWAGENVSGVPNIFALADLASGGTLAPILIGSPNPRPIRAARQEMITERYARCQAIATTAFRSSNAVGNELTNSWISEALSLQRSDPVRISFRRFGACVRAENAPPSAGGSPEAFDEWLTKLLEPTVADPYGDTRLIERDSVLDNYWTKVFVKCAAPALEVEYRIQTRSQALFVRRNRLLIDDLVRDVAYCFSRLDRRFG
jgi:hypothetical protein